MSFRTFIKKLDRFKSGKTRDSRCIRSSESHTHQTTDRDISGRFRKGVPIDDLAKCADNLKGIRRSEVRQGDWILVQTKNSLYKICAVGGNRFSVSGGWFDREGVSPQEITIEGCTWGGRAINVDLIAARGLFLGFGNSVVTTRIRNFRIFRDDDLIFRS